MEAKYKKRMKGAAALVRTFGLSQYIIHSPSQFILLPRQLSLLLPRKIGQIF